MIYDAIFDFDSKYIIELGDFKIAWYAACILFGVIMAAIMGVKEAKRFGISSNLILDGVLICVPLAIVGARLYYVFTSWDKFWMGNFADTFMKIIGYDNGSFKLEGLAINGGIIVAIIFVIVYCKLRKLNVFQIFDLLAPGLLIGQIFGRWGNFFNQEAHGPAMTAQEFATLSQILPAFIMEKMHFWDSSLQTAATWHPTFLYESLWNLVGLTIILISRRKNKHQRIGDCICFYLIWYGLGRALIIEPLRMDPLLFDYSLGMGYLFNRVNVVINLLLAVAGIIWLVLKHLVFKEPFYLDVQRKIKEEKIDGVVVRLDETLVTTTKLLENAYYYTAIDYLGVELTDEELADLIKKDPKEYFKDETALNAFNEYFNTHVNQLNVVLETKDFFKSLYKHDYKISLVTSYSLEFALNALDVLKLSTYISIITTDNDINGAINKINDAKNILVISSKKGDVLAANNHNAKSCLVCFGDEIDEACELEPTYLINRVSQLDQIIII